MKTESIPFNIVKKIWVFDLDGTLWSENSHVSIVENHLGRRKYTNIFAKIYGRIFFDSYMKKLNTDFKDVSQEEILSFSPHIRENIRFLLEEAKTNNDIVLIISNAPDEINQVAENMFSVEAIHSEIGEKFNTLNKRYKKWDRLFVCTDNQSDKDLLYAADMSFFLVNKSKYRSAKKLMDEIGCRSCIIYKD